MAILNIRVGTKTTYTRFFIVESGTNYNAILGRDWLHHNYAIPSSLHQVLILWNVTLMKWYKQMMKFT